MSQVKIIEFPAKSTLQSYVPAGMAEWIECSPRSRDVVGLSPDRANPKAIKYDNKTRTGWLGVRIM